VLRFLVALAPVRDLFLFAKHLFVAVRRHIVFARHFAVTILLPLRKFFSPTPSPPKGLPVCAGSDFKKKEKIQKTGFLRISLFSASFDCLDARSQRRLLLVSAKRLLYRQQLCNKSFLHSHSALQAQPGNHSAVKARICWKSAVEMTCLIR